MLTIIEIEPTNIVGLVLGGVCFSFVVFLGLLLGGPIIVICELTYLYFKVGRSGVIRRCCA